MADFQPSPLATPRVLLESQEGLTLIPAGVVKFRESYRVFRKVFVDREDIGDPQRAHSLEVAIRHEAAHFVQSITAPYVFDYGEQVRKLALQAITCLKEGAPGVHALAELRARLARINVSLDEEQGKFSADGVGVSPRQLMEAVAVIESLRSLIVDLDVRQVLEHLPRGRAEITYGRVLGLMVRQLGPSPTIHLTSSVCYLALSSPRPGETFVAMLETLARQPASEIAKLRAGDPFDVFAFNVKSGLLAVAAAGQRVSVFPMWNEYVRDFAQSGPLAVVHRVASNPSTLLAKTNWSEQLDTKKIAEIGVPPLAMFSDGYAQVMGRAKYWDNAAVMAFIGQAALIGAGVRVLSRADVFQPCAHSACPVHATRLCHFYYPPPPESDWRECSFRPMLEGVTGKTLDEICRLAGIQSAPA
jgi:hypothetical protein